MYEIIIILDPALSEEEIEGQVNDFRELILKGKGEVVEIQRWGKKRLAYELKKRKEGVYLLFRVSGDPQCVIGLEKVLKISEKVLQYMRVRLEEVQIPPSEKVETKKTEEAEAAAEATGGV